VPEIVICPKCHVRVEKDNLGELLCPKCGVRLCPKAHIVDGKICPYCGWEDTNYYLWQKAQKVRPKSSEVEKSGQFLDGKPQQVCPRCGIVIEATAGRCSGCGWLYGSKPRGIQQSAASISSTLKSEPRRPASLPGEPTRPAARQPGTPPQSPLLHELKKIKHREWDFTPIRRFLQPFGASLLVCAVLFGAFLLVKEVLIPVFSQPAGKASPQAMPPPVFNPAKLYTLTAKAAPEGGGRIQVSPPSERGTFESGITVILTAIPDECHNFSYWEGDVSDSSKNPIPLTIDSNKSVTAHFNPTDMTAPAITKVEVSRCSDISATITWNTDEPAKGQVEYGKTEADSQPTPTTKEFTTSHSVRLTGLEPNTTYYFRVKAEDKCGNDANTVAGKLKTSDTISAGHEVGKRAPLFTLTSYQDDNPESPNKGQTVSLNNFQGKKVLLNFWSTSCGPCITEFPLFRELYYDNQCNKNTGNVAVITIGIDNRPDRIKLIEDKYQAEYGRFTFPMLLDVQEKPTKDKYRIWRVPTTFFIDSDGIVREIKTGRFTSLEEIETILNSLE